MQLGSSYAVSFSRDSSRLAVLASDVTVLDTIGKGRVFRSRPCKHPSHVLFSQDGRELFVKSTSGCLMVLDAWDGAVLRTLDAGGVEGCSPTLSASGQYLLDGSWDGRITLWDVTTGVAEWQREFAGEMIHGLCCLASRGMWLSVHSPKATTEDRPPLPDYFCLWSHPIPGMQPIRVVRPKLPFVRAVAASPTDDALAIVHGAPPRTLSVVETENWAVTATVAAEYGGCGSALAWSVRGLLASVQNARVELYRASSLRHLGGISLPYASDVAWSADGGRLALGSWKKGRLVRPAEMMGDVAEQGDETDEAFGGTQTR